MGTMRSFKESQIEEGKELVRETEREGVMGSEREGQSRQEMNSCWVCRNKSRQTYVNHVLNYIIPINTRPKLRSQCGWGKPNT